MNDFLILYAVISVIVAVFFGMFLTTMSMAGPHEKKSQDEEDRLWLKSFLECFVVLLFIVPFAIPVILVLKLYEHCILPFFIKDEDLFFLFPKNNVSL